MRIHQLTESIIGKKIGINIKDKNKNLLIKKGHVITDKKYKLLKKHNIEFIKIEEPNPEEEHVKDLSSREFELFKKEDYLNLIEKLANTHSLSKKQILKMDKIIPLDINRTINIYLTEMKGLTDKKEIKIKNTNNYMFEHQVMVMILVTYIGTNMGYNKEKLRKVANASLIYDFGNFLLDPRLLTKKEKLSDKEIEELKSHVLKGYNFLKANTKFSFDELIPVLQHHERIDGSGYPKGLKGNLIHEFSKLIAIADVYDAMTTDRPYRIGYSQKEVLEYLMATTGSLYDEDIVKIFIKKINPYPKGSKVILSNGEKGFVFNENKNWPLNPIIMRTGKNYTGGYLNLLENKNIIIENII